MLRCVSKMKPQTEIIALQNVCRQEKKRRRERHRRVLNGTRYHFIGHLSWKRSWSSLTMVATVLSESAPSASFTTSCR